MPNKPDVKKGESFVKIYLVLSLLVIYLVIAATCILYLPKYSPLRPVNNYTKINTYLVLKPTHQMEHPVADMLVLLHQVYKSTVENKRPVLNGSSQTALVFISLIFGAIALTGLLKKSGGHCMLFRYSPQYAYLSYCTLRI
ncbi:MAG: hypothetical protein JWP78_3561 [Mucilaginibacter sp.]|nr:hypothetical protein [Mucilaginibacter sp.]